jgi:hypothetical protein
MTAGVLKMTRPQPDDPDPRVRLSSDDSGGWVLSGPGNPPRHFTDLGTALDTARRSPGTQDATIEVWQDSEYICCLPAEEHPYCGPGAPFGRAVPQGRVMTAAERYANRAAEVLMMTAGPLFWAALVVLVLAGSLGWRLAL